MGGGGVDASGAKVRNVVHEDENWRQRLRGELDCLKSWEVNYGYLRKEGTAHDEDSTQATRLAKYYDCKKDGPNGASGWSIRQIRVAKDEEQQDKTEMELRQGFVAKTKGNNLELCNRRPGSNLQTTYQDFGLKYSLELFGVGQHAKTQVTKEFWS